MPYDIILLVFFLVVNQKQQTRLAMAHQNVVEFFVRGGGERNAGGATATTPGNKVINVLVVLSMRSDSIVHEHMRLAN